MNHTVEPTLQHNLHKLIKSAKLNVKQFSDKIGLSPTPITRILTDKNYNPTLGSIRAISEFFNITPNQLLGIDPLQSQKEYNPEFETWIGLPILHQNQLSEWLQHGPDYLIKNKLNLTKTDVFCSELSFALKANDGSLEPRFPEGSILIFDPKHKPNNKNIILLQHKESLGFQFRELILDGPEQFIQPINPALRNPTNPFKPLDNNQYTVFATLIQAKMNFVT